jgi:3-isopropylmalate/(R)-2-methylmalate dehydratase small subunit
MAALGTEVAIQRVEGRGVPVRGDDIDTDQIIPARYLKWITFKGLEAHVFEDVRMARAQHGHPHPFDDPRFKGGRILITNRNFGCGSSREHAAQAIKRFGVAAIIGESFGEIFAGNCVSIGMPCVTADAATIRTLQCQCAAEPMTKFVLDLVSMTVDGAGRTFSVHLTEGRRRQFLEGSWDATAVLLGAAPSIDAKLRLLPPLSNALSSTDPLKSCSEAVHRSRSRRMQDNRGC